MYFIMLKTAHAGFRGAESGAAPQRQTAFQSFELFMVLIMKTRMIRILCAAAFLALGLGGCSRIQMNFQIGLILCMSLNVDVIDVIFLQGRH